MRVAWFLFLSCYVSLSQAETIRSTIYEVVVSSKQEQPHLVKLANGRVALLNSLDKATLSAVQTSHVDQDLVAIEVDVQNNLLSVQTVANKRDIAPMSVETSGVKIAQSYEPTIVPNYTAASNIFRRMRRNYQGHSQCYNRAHVWSYEEFMRNDLRSMKMFLFTNRYIRNFRFGWWFHVAPMVYVQEGRAVNRRVLDRKYLGGPRYINGWTAFFVRSGRTCKQVTKYSSYRRHQESQDCYVIPASMYFWQPLDIENQERTGQEKTFFKDWEVGQAYLEAF